VAAVSTFFSKVDRVIQLLVTAVKVVIGYSSNFSDPVVCENIANKQITDNLADIIFRWVADAALVCLTRQSEKCV
jgi:hypothetical protein